MTKLDDAMMSHISKILFIDRRPFSYLDFKSFTVSGKSYSIPHGTFRNKISKLKKEGRIINEYNSNVAFYTLPNYQFKTMTPNHMGNSSVIRVTNLIEFVKELPFEKKSIHDIHYKFQVPDIWKIVSSNRKYTVNPVSKDIKLRPLITENLKIQTTIHHTDTVSVVVGCSLYPVVIEDVEGIIRVSNALTRIEEKLSRVVDECGDKLEGGYESIPIPENGRWTVTMWHFGRDGKGEYAGDGFSITWGNGRGALIRVYAKNIENRKKLRIESQESPNKTLSEAIMEKLNGPN